MEPSQSPSNASRRQFIKKTATASAGFTIVPSHVVSGQGKVPPPSETLGGALIGAGGRGPGTFKRLGDNVQMLAKCDVKYVGQEDNKTVYSDFRRLLERKDIDVVAIATPPHWHALISMAAAAAVWYM